MRWQLTVIPVWLLSAVGALLVGLYASPNSYLVWLPVVLAGAVLLTFIFQLALVQKSGLVNRMTASLVGAAIILAAATAVLWPLSLT